MDSLDRVAIAEYAPLISTDAAAKTEREHKTLRTGCVEKAKRKGFLLRRNRTRDRQGDNYGL